MLRFNLHKLFDTGYNTIYTKLVPHQVYGSAIARVMAKLSLDGLVEKSSKKVSKQAISKYENGLMIPDSSVIIARR